MSFNVHPRSSAHAWLLAGVILIAPALLQACGKSCEYEGRTYDDGDKWTCSDGCNTCGCADGQVIPTRLACNHDGGM